jgi:hypothetical protein
MHRLINDMLDYDRVRSGIPRVCRSIVDVTQLRMSVEGVIGREANERRILLAWRGFDHSAPMIWADQEKLRRFLVNLGMNALKITPEGGRITVYIGAGDGANVRIGLRDTGRGFDSRQLAKVIEDGKLRTDGLGLTICRQIAALHHSWLWLNSEPNCGSCFEAFFPLASPVAAASALAKWRSGHPAAANARDGFTPLPDQQTAPRFEDVAIISVFARGLSLERLEEVDRLLQVDLRMHETAYRVCENCWVLAWDIPPGQCRLRQTELSTLIDHHLRKELTSMDKSLSWSDVNWYRTAGGSRSPFVEAFVRASLEIGDLGLDLDNLSTSTTSEFDEEYRTTHERVGRRLNHEIRRLSKHFRERQFALERSIPSKLPQK